jgi:Tol biopolymer transport system component
MPDGTAPRRAPEWQANTRLESWKEIAAYLRREVRTVQRWEKTDGLPVHRLYHSKRGSVYALTAELDRWRQTRSDAVAQEKEPDGEDVAAPLAPPREPRVRWVAASAIAVLLVGMAAWFVGRAAGTPEPRVTYETNLPGDEDTPELSPDGRDVAFSWNGPAGTNHDIYVSRIGEGGVKRLTTSPEWDYSPSWSPKGDRVAFLRARSDGAVDVLMVGTNGGSEQRISEVHSSGSTAAVKHSGLTWTPDGHWVIVSGTDSNEPQGLLLIPVTPGASRRLTVPPKGAFDLEPALSPDGRILAFRRETGFSVSELMLLELGTDYSPSAPERPLSARLQVRASSPRWESARSLLYLARGRLMRAEIGADKLVHGEPRDISPDIANCALVSFSYRASRPRGLLGECERNQPYAFRLELPVTAERPPRLTRIQQAEGVALSPDGKQLAFEAWQFGGSHVWVSNIDGTGRRILTAEKGMITGSPAWSPDGKWIAFDSNAEGRTNIYVIPAAGGKPRRLTYGLADHNLPQWSRDGRWIYFALRTSGPFELARIPFEGGEPIRITNGGATASVEAQDGASVYYQRRTANAWSLRRCGVDGSGDREVIPELLDRAWGVTANGIYFVPMPGPDERSSIQYLDLATMRTKTVTPIQKPERRAISISADGALLVFSQFERWGRDLALIEGVN